SRWALVVGRPANKTGRRLQRFAINVAVCGEVAVVGNVEMILTRSDEEYCRDDACSRIGTSRRPSHDDRAVGIRHVLRILALEKRLAAVLNRGVCNTPPGIGSADERRTQKARLGVLADGGADRGAGAVRRQFRAGVLAVRPVRPDSDSYATWARRDVRPAML